MLRSRGLFVVAAALVVAACTDRVPAGPDDDGSLTPVISPSIAAGPERVMPGEIVAKAKPGVDLAAVARGHGLALGRRGYAGRFLVLRVAPGRERSAAAALRQDGRIAYAEPNYLRQAEAVDPKLWAFYNPGGLNMRFTSGQNRGGFIPARYASTADADEDNIENYASGGEDVVIGSLDTGVDFLHAEFTGRLIAGRDWWSHDDDPTDANGHGTHTTGTMAGGTVGVAGVAGVAARVKVYVQRVCGPPGCPTDAIVSAMLAAADYPNLVAMNLSLGGPSESQAEKDAIAYATAKGVLVIASAGNGGTAKLGCPACDPNAIAVAATQWQDQLATYSQYGPGLDIAAPGGTCYSNTTPEGCIYSAYMGGGYAWLQGTSMAAPQVTGTAGVVASVGGLRGTALRDRLLETADDLGARGYDTQFGHGRLNSYRAVTNGTLPQQQ